MKWYSLTHLNHSSSNEILADVEVMPDSPWFSGHFPREPILPGIAQLGMVFDAITKSCNQALKISSVRRVRFKQIIRPDDHLRIIVTPLKKNGWSYSFRIMVEAELACSGVMTVENRMDNIKGTAKTQT